MIILMKSWSMVERSLDLGSASVSVEDEESRARMSKIGVTNHPPSREDVWWSTPLSNENTHRKKGGGSYGRVSSDGRG
jgi:hypothetical protein